MVVALIALVVAVGGVAGAAIVGSDGSIKACVAKRNFATPLATAIKGYTDAITPAGALRAIDQSQSCSGDETPLTLDKPATAGATGGLVVTTFATVDKSTKLTNNASAYATVLSASVPAGSYVISGLARTGVHGGDTQGKSSCELFRPNGTQINRSGGNSTIRTSRGDGYTTIALAGYSYNQPAGAITVRCRMAYTQINGLTAYAGARLTLIKDADN